MLRTALFVLSVLLLYTEISGTGGISGIRATPIVSPTLPSLILFFVSLFLISGLCIGFNSVISAWERIRTESYEFERTRTDDKAGNPEKDSSVSRDSGEVSQPHHSVRSELIEKAYRTGSRLPSLSDLRTLTYGSESSRTPVWSTGIVISVLLIVGILGTLAGVHGSIAAEGFRIEKLQPALLPGVIAVSGTVVLILLRGMYHRAVDVYIGRLDRHTISYYFPKFRKAELSALELANVTSEIASLSLSITKVSVFISRMAALPEMLEKPHGKLMEIHRNQRQVFDAVRCEQETPARFSTMMVAALARFGEHNVNRGILIQGMENVCREMRSVSSILTAAQIQTYAEKSEPFSRELERIQQGIAEVPYMPPSRCREVQSRWRTVEGVGEMIRTMNESGQTVDAGLAKCIREAEVSAGKSQTTLKMYYDMIEEIDRNNVDYAQFRSRLDTMYRETRGKLEEVVERLRNGRELMRDIEDKLKAQKRTAPMFHWYEVVAGGCFAALLVYNVYLTINL